MASNPPDSWAVYVLKNGAKIGMNIVAPGSSLIFDLYEICYDFYEGDYISGAIGIVFALVGVVTFGKDSSVRKNVAIFFAKMATGIAIKKGGKEVGKLVGKILGSEIGKNSSRYIQDYWTRRS